MEEKKNKKAGMVLGIFILLVFISVIAWQAVYLSAHKQPMQPIPEPKHEINYHDVPTTNSAHTLTASDLLARQFEKWPNCVLADVNENRVMLDYSAHQSAEDVQSEALTAAQALSAIRATEGKGYSSIYVRILENEKERYSMLYKPDAGVTSQDWHGTTN